MSGIETLFSALGIKLKTLIAGAAGSAISLKFFDDLTVFQRWTTFLCGMVLAIFLTEGMAYYLEIKTLSLEVGLAFLIGLFGMSITGSIMQLIKTTDWGKTLVGFFQLKKTK